MSILHQMESMMDYFAPHELKGTLFGVSNVEAPKFVNDPIPTLIFGALFGPLLSGLNWLASPCNIQSS